MKIKTAVALTISVTLVTLITPLALMYAIGRAVDDTWETDK